MARIVVTPRSLIESGHPVLNALRETRYDVIFSSPGQQPSEVAVFVLAQQYRLRDACATSI